MTDLDDIRDRIEDLEQRADPTASGIVAVGAGEDYLSPDEFSERYGGSPSESDALVIHVPEEAGEF